MVLMIALTMLDIANGHKVPTDQLILWDTVKAKEVLIILIFISFLLALYIKLNKWLVRKVNNLLNPIIF